MMDDFDFGSDLGALVPNSDLEMSYQDLHEMSYSKSKPEMVKTPTSSNLFDKEYDNLINQAFFEFIDSPCSDDTPPPSPPASEAKERVLSPDSCDESPDMKPNFNSEVGDSLPHVKRIYRLFPKEVLRSEAKEWRKHNAKLCTLTPSEQKIVQDLRRKNRNCVYAERARQKRIAKHKEAREKADSLQKLARRTEEEYQAIVTENESLKSKQDSLVQLVLRYAGRSRSVEQEINKLIA